MSFNLFSRLMPAEEAFTPLFCEQAQCIVQAAAELRQMIGNDIPGEQRHVATIRDIEMAADAVARRIFIGANRTFNAPIDREDIMALAHLLDDCVDLIEDTAKGIQRYGVREFPVEMRAIADAMVEAAGVLQKVMPYLDSLGKDYKAISALCEQVGQIEGRADESLDLGLTRLRAQLRTGEIDTIGYIDRKELYELIEAVVDKCDDVANAVESITAKHV
jgi:predicted phosphate transport protein (TIGR00153 family)